MLARKRALAAAGVVITKISGTGFLLLRPKYFIYIAQLLLAKSQMILKLHQANARFLLMVSVRFEISGLALAEYFSAKVRLAGKMI